MLIFLLIKLHLPLGRGGEWGMTPPLDGVNLRLPLGRAGDGV